MKLVLAEKPSVAQSIAKVLGAAKREDGYLEGNGYVVSWCVGHLVELAQPEVYDAKYSKWAYADLPIFPMDWQYEVSAGTKKQFGILKKLMAREDVASLVCATDAGREGELIFRLVYHKAGCRKPFERLWISSMEDVAIKEGFENLRSGTEYDALYEAALCRERADWIVGMEELGQRLGLKEATAYELVAKGHFDVVDVLGKRRVTKESFERWYASQTDYRTVEDQELDADIMASTYGLPEMARMLGVHRQTIYYIVANEDFELIKVGRYKRATKESFEKWYHNQTRYQLAEDRQERS